MTLYRVLCPDCTWKSARYSTVEAALRVYDRHANEAGPGPNTARITIEKHETEESK